MLYGYNGKIARVDLTAGKVSYDQIDKDTARSYFGGVGLAAKILWEETGANTDPLSPENPLIFMTGPLTGTMVPASSRYVVAGISPLTGIWGEAHSGGSWADELRHSGFDGLVVTGQAAKPMYLWLYEGSVEIRDAQHVWGRDTYEVDGILKRETHEKASVACIGRAGERLVRIACVMNDGEMGRAAARCGLGALMGSKRLKAVVARGTLPIGLYNEEGLRDSVRKYYAVYPIKKPKDALAGHIRMAKDLINIGSYPVKNWTQGVFGPALDLADELRTSTPMYCKRCSSGCLESKFALNGERHMVYEHWGPIGANCLIGDAKALQEAYSLCSRYGMDSISTGGVVAFGMECFEKGLITKDDTDGIDLTWGNHEAMVEMVRQIGEGEGVGRILGLGVKRAAEQIGGNSSEFAIHAKGLEFPAPEPRAAMTVAVEYAVESIGAGHMEAIRARGIENGLELEPSRWRKNPELGYNSPLNRLDIEGKGILTAKVQNAGCMLNCLVVCCLETALRGVQHTSYLEMIRTATGWEMDLKDYLFVGERIVNLKRMFDVRRGISRKDDTLPARILTQTRGSGRSANSLPVLEPMLDEYYQFRGWSDNGIPTKQKLMELGLHECLSLGA